MTVSEVRDKLLKMPDDATVKLATSLYMRPRECNRVLDYDTQYNDVWMIGSEIVER